jgi:hypothetical protein
MAYLALVKPCLPPYDSLSGVSRTVILMVTGAIEAQFRLWLMNMKGRLQSVTVDFSLQFHRYVKQMCCILVPVVCLKDMFRVHGRSQLLPTYVNLSRSLAWMLVYMQFRMNLSLCSQACCSLMRIVCFFPLGMPLE